MAESLAARIAEEIVAGLGGGPPVIVATVIAGPEADAVGRKVLVRADGSTLGELRDSAFQAGVAREALARRGVETIYVSPDGRRVGREQAESGEAYQVMVELHEAPATLLIMGGGHIGKALAVIGDLCGFRIVVVDDRAEYANAERFPEADEIVCGRFEEVLPRVRVDSSTYAVCVTRGHRQDETSLRAVVGSPAPYVGMIGSKRRVGAVLQHLVEEGIDAEAIARVHTPIGLDIGAETPEEIAVAIMAEVIQARRGGSGRSMRDVKRSRRAVA